MRERLLDLLDPKRAERRQIHRILSGEWADDLIAKWLAVNGSEQS